MSYREYYVSPIGVLEMCANEDALTSILFVEKAGRSVANKITAKARHQLDEYFQRARTQFDLPLAANGTQFQKTVWRQLSKIPYGETCSYSEIAQAVNRPKAVRAVGSANGKNMFTIVVPCHRVIAANGSLAGYASGVDRKAWLLKHESENHN